MNPLVLLLIGGVGAFLWWRSTPSGQQALQSFTTGTQGVIPTNPYYLRQPTLAPGNAPRVQAPTSGPGNPIPGAITSVGTGALIGAIGPGSAVIGAATAGIGAGVAVLTWAIVEKGLFRGGEEGVFVNPARDAFFQQFIDYARSVGAAIDYSWQQPALVFVLSNFTALDGNQQNALITAMFQADTKTEYINAAKAIALALAPSGFRVQIPT